MTPFDQDLSNIGYVYISEASGIQDVNNVDVSYLNGIPFVSFDACLQSFDIMNRNQRMYSGQNIWSCIQTEKIQSALKHNGWFSEMDHPYQKYEQLKLTPERMRSIDFNNRCSVIKSPRMQNNMLYAHIETTPGSENGRGLAADMIAIGYKPMYSVRAIAGMQLMNGKPYVIVRLLITYDTVNYASHREADMVTPGKVVTKCVKNGDFLESTSGDYEGTINYNDVMIPLKDILTDINDDSMAGFVMESFDLPEENLIGFNEEKTHAIIKDRDNRIYVKMNPNTVRKVNDFLSSF